MRILRGFCIAAIVLGWGIIPPGPFGSCDLKPGEAPCCSISGVSCPNQACLCFWICGDFSFCKCSCAGGGSVLVQVNPLLAIPLSTPFGQKNSDVVILGDLADRIAGFSNWVVTVDEGIRSRPIFANVRTGTYEEVLISLAGDANVNVTIDQTTKRVSFWAN